MVEMAESADTTVRTRLQIALGRPIADPQVRMLIAGLSGDTLRNAAAGWFGDTKAKEASKATPVPNTNQTDVKTNSERRPIAFATAGTWFRDETSLSIRYRPSAHADPVLAAWLSVLADTDNLNRRPVAAAMFKDLSKPNAPGLCASCHSLEQATANIMAVNWRAYDRTKEPHGFTKFAHGPHLLLPQLSDCTHCHTIDAAASAAVAYTDLNPARFVGDFVPISKRQCTECHTAMAAGDACQQCHNYHVESAEMWRIQEPPSRSAVRNSLFELR